ncbi:uncharacterized protein LOC121857557 [Homarus americanus]|uniref:uncharacterized protein LOC121857557 n=1 Tax=Homarus americanus TaxID=6706 RepID=UPI001C461001|nr:uncharacterized protein LOC121857557 [Homarus americanus]
MVDRIWFNVKVYCVLWFNIDLPVVVRVSGFKYMWYKTWGNYKDGLLQPYMLECPIPTEYNHLVPLSMSLIEQPCYQPTNNLRVINKQPVNGKKNDFVVCVKGLLYGNNDQSVRLIEWLEVLFQLGANKVVIYDLNIPYNMTRVLNYYQKRGQVQVIPLTLPGYLPNLASIMSQYLKRKYTTKRQNEVIPYNDCLYNNMNLYKFVVLLDTDEFIMPRKAKSWKDVISLVAPKALSGQEHTKSSYCARNIYFLDSMQKKQTTSKYIPKFMYFTNNLYRAVNYTKPGAYVKCYHDTERVLTLHNHYPFSCLRDHCSNPSIPTTIAHLQHYRSGCVNELKKQCHIFLNKTRVDDGITRFSKAIVHNSLRTLRHLGMFMG